MHVRYHFMEPGEELALVRMTKGSSDAHERTIPIVITIRKKDFRELIQGLDLKAALLDFDGTFTRIGTMYSLETQREECYQTGWQELRRRLPPEGHRDLDRHYRLYKRHMEGGEDITALEWLYISIACYHQYGLTLNDILESAGKVPFREGHEEFIDLLRRRFQKSFIVSFGMTEWIECRKEFEKFPHDTIASTMILDEHRKIVGVRASVTEDTKGIAAKRLLARRGWSKKNAFAIGNSWHDRHLFSAAGISVYLSHGGYKGSGIDHAAEIERLQGVATAIIFDDTLHGVSRFLQDVFAKAI